MIIGDVDDRITYSGFCIRFRPNKNKIRPLFLLYLFKSPQFRKQFSKYQQTSINNLNQDILSSIELELPDIRTQELIVKCIHSITEKIEINQHINDNLQQQLKLLYDYWFTQFDFPNENGKPYRSSGGAMVWNEQLKCKIPLGWKVTSITNNNLFQIIKPGINSFIGNKNYLATADIVGTAISNGSLIYYKNRESRANMQPSIFSVWFAKMKNSVKHLYLNSEMKSIVKNTILSTGFCGLQCSKYSFEYISSFIEHSYFETTKDILAHGATQEAINNDDLYNICLLNPSDDILHLYHEKTKEIYAQISTNICENQKLSQLRDWLLPMLMNGQATISD